MLAVTFSSHAFRWSPSRTPEGLSRGDEEDLLGHILGLRTVFQAGVSGADHAGKRGTEFFTHI